MSEQCQCLAMPGDLLKLIVYNCRQGISVAKAGCAGTIGVRRNRRLRASIHGIAIVINRQTGCGIARIRPNDVSAGGVGNDANVIADELLLQVVVAGAIGIRGNCADPYRPTKGRSTRCRLSEVVVVDLNACLKGIVCRGLRQGVKGKANGAIGCNASLWEEGVAARDAGNRAKLGPLDAIERDRPLDYTVPAAKVAPDDVDALAAGVRSRVWVA